MRKASVLTLLAVMAACTWNGSPKVPVDPRSTACLKDCPGRVCAADGDKWTCLPEAK